MTVFSHFDQIRIINLASRTDRRREMDRELERAGLKSDARVSYFPAIRPNDAGTFTSIGARGVYESQKQILREAAGANQSVLILEDDCEFITGAWNCELPAGWDIFYGGHYATNLEDLINSDIVGAHMMGFSREGAKSVSTYLEQLEYEGIHPPIDAAYVWFRRAYPKVATHFAVPPMAGQRSSRSDIAALRWFDRMPIVRMGVSVLRVMRRG